MDYCCWPGSIAHNTSLGFERQFASAAMALGPHARLQVHYSIVPGKHFHARRTLAPLIVRSCAPTVAGIAPLTRW